MKKQVYRNIKESTESQVRVKVSTLILEGWEAVGNILKHVDRKTGTVFYQQGVIKPIKSSS